MRRIILVDEIPYPIKTAKFEGLKVGDLNFKEFKLILFGVEKRSIQDFVFNPAKEMRIEKGDILLVFGHHISIEYFKNVTCFDRC